MIVLLHLNTFKISHFVFIWNIRRTVCRFSSLVLLTLTPVSQGLQAAVFTSVIPTFSALHLIHISGISKGQFAVLVSLTGGPPIIEMAVEWSKHLKNPKNCWKSCLVLDKSNRRSQWEKGIFANLSWSVTFNVPRLCEGRQLLPTRLNCQSEWI